MRLKLYRVTGESMMPGLTCGSYVLTFNHQWQKFGVGDVVVADHPDFGRIIKRVTGIRSNNCLMLAGDNSAQSTRTEVIGAVPRNLVLGRVIWQTRPASGTPSVANCETPHQKSNGDLL